jgi:hypothetical protein
MDVWISETSSLPGSPNQSTNSKTVNFVLDNLMLVGDGDTNGYMVVDQILVDDVSIGDVD